MNRVVVGLCFILAACGGGFKEIDVSVVPTRIDIVNPAPPRQVVMRDVNWIVLNRERLEALLADPSFDENTAFFVLSPRDYENLSLNVAELLRYIEQQKEVVLYYRRTIDNLNNEAPTETP